MAFVFAATLPSSACTRSWHSCRSPIAASRSLCAAVSACCCSALSCARARRSSVNIMVSSSTLRVCARYRISKRRASSSAPAPAPVLYLLPLMLPFSAESWTGLLLAKPLYMP